MSLLQGLSDAPWHVSTLLSLLPLLPQLPLPNRCRFFILGWRQDKEDKEGKKTRGENRTEFGSVKLTSKSRNALFFVLTLPCLLVYLSSLSYLNRNLKKPTLVRLPLLPQLPLLPLLHRIYEAAQVFLPHEGFELLRAKL